MKKLLKKNYLLLAIIIILGTIVIGFYLISQANSMNEYLPLPEESLSWYIQLESPQGDNSIYLNYAYIKQDFTNNKGELSFVITNQANITLIVFNFPKDIKKESNLECFTQPFGDYSLKKDTLEKLNCTTIMQGNKTRVIQLNKISFMNERILIKYDYQIEPIGYFNYHVNQIWYANSEGNVIFDLGTNYECVANCVYPWQNIEFATSNSEGQVQNILFSKPLENRDFVFKIITKSSKIIRDKNIRGSIGSSLIAGAILTIVSLLIYFQQIKDSLSKPTPPSKHLKTLFFYKKGR